MLSDLDFLKGMVEIYSTSGNEAKVAGFIVEQMRERGFKSYVDEVGNAVGEIGHGERTILLVGHIDTVPGEIPVRVRGGKLYGRGTVDAKGPFAAFVCAASNVKNLSDRKIIVVGAVEEECATSKGARNLIGRYEPSAIIIGEPSGYDGITIGYKGRLLIDYSLDKDISHTAREDESVVEQAVNFFLKLKGNVYAHNEDKPGAFDRLQISLRELNSTSDGFTDSAYMKIGFRTPVGFDSEGFKQFINFHKGTGKAEVYGEEVAIKSDKNNMLVRQFLKSIREHNLMPKFKLKTGTSDMNVLGHAYKGVPIVAYGPGDSSLDHTPNEHIDIKEFSKSIEVLTQVLDNV